MKLTHPKTWQVHGVLFYDNKKEEGRLRLRSSMPKDVVGLDILQDWIVELQDAYDKLHKETFNERAERFAQHRGTDA